MEQFASGNRAVHSVGRPSDPAASCLLTLAAYPASGPVAYWLQDLRTCDTVSTLFRRTTFANSTCSSGGGKHTVRGLKQRRQVRRGNRTILPSRGWSL